MERRLDLDGWRRRPHFEHFKDFAQPFFGVTAEVDVSQLRKRSRSAGTSFFLASLHASLLAANSVPAFRRRIRGADEVVEHDQIDCSATVLRDDDTFSFAYFDFHRSREKFLAQGAGRIEVARRREGLGRDGADDTIYYSVLPWFRFTSFTHARREAASGESPASIPRIVLGGRYRSDSGRFLMPVSVELHHAVADGIDVARFLRSFQEELDEELDSHGGLDSEADSKVAEG